MINLMTSLGNHAGFIVASYAIAAVVVVALIAWIGADYRQQLRTLRLLEEAGIRRRSSAQGEIAGERR